MTDSSPRSVAVIGGGIAGLAAAHRAGERAGAHVVLYEAAPRLGGTIRTHEHDGFLLEDGPDSFLIEKPAGRALIARLGIESRLVGVTPAFRRSYLVHRRRLVPTPEGLQLMAPVRIGPFLRTPVLSVAGKLRILMEPLLPPRRTAEDESLASFVSRRLGREALARLAQPMIAGIYGADPETLSLRSTFPRFLEMEQREGSVLLGLRRAMRRSATAGTEASGPRYGLFATFDRGMQVLTDTLASRLPADSIRRSSPVTAIARDGANGWTVNGGSTIERFDAVVIALPGPEASRLLSGLDGDAAALLSEIPYGGAATVSLAYRSDQIAHSMQGAGFVAAAVEGMSLLGCTFSHRKFERRAPEGFALLRAFHGERTYDLDDAALVGRTRAELDPLLGISGAPLFTHVARYDAALPRYPVGHTGLVSRLAERMQAHAGLVLAGPPAVGAGVPDAIAAAELAVESLFTP